jgi:hypothetical protein
MPVAILSCVPRFLCYGSDRESACAGSGLAAVGCRHVRCTLSPIAATVSLLLCAATIASWWCVQPSEPQVAPVTLRSVLPTAFLASLFAILPLAAAVRHVRRRRGAQRVQAGRCIGCGNDLRATPERCPECGRASG